MTMAVNSVATGTGIVLMVLGMSLVVVALFRSMKHQWAFGIHELWLLPVLGVALILLGRWLVV